MKSIASRHNPWFKRVREAIREHADEIVLEGPKMVADALAAGWEPIAVLECGGHAAALSGRGAASQIELSPELFEALSETKTSQGVLGLFHRPHNADIFARAEAPVVALDGVQDPGNVGTIVRLAAAFDASGVALLPGCADPFSPKAIRASAGAILSVPVARLTHEELLGAGRPLLYADGRGEAVPPAGNAVLVFGSEGSGVSEFVCQHGRAVAVATSGRVESLNVAASAAILLWQTFAGRHQIR